MARIIAGTHKGRRLAAVPGEGTRPTSDRVKESLFSRLEGYDAIGDAVVVDLFAGSGALGLEALSRGARRAELVDRAEPALRTLRRNAALFDAGAVTVQKSEALRHLRRREGEPIELLFLDPPYAFTEQQLAEVLAAAVPQLHPAATVVVERESRSPEPQWPAGLERFQDRAYGTTRLWFAEPA
ncbi:MULTISPECIES: 16S rRNA (guanine(966)-N(2))-methyltransferase RsmD [Actinomycetes]|uniref:16S rRNA (Guanine(966)-N(2))-methyltransferase RsmD n=2 Tax=Actinomycetes TaxID=1760 RepID=A0ABP6LSH5_9MICC|nr:16S rRNA (guanine(966)-N(2))-methyltransferase RsmD [Nesterenkonia sp. CL21]MDS2171565.1 16S rRNA (guanine(966)-N(2))-methyltransferase RsmD [Nesterenkonia sp. CL21]